MRWIKGGHKFLRHSICRSCEEDITPQYISYESSLERQYNNQEPNQEPTVQLGHLAIISKPAKQVYTTISSSFMRIWILL